MRKKIISLIGVLALCISLACPVFAAEDFVPSITDKSYPAIVPVQDADGNDAVGVVCDADGNIIDYVYEQCLLITAVSKAESSTQLPESAKETLLDVYEQLSEGSMTLPYGEGVDPTKMVIRDLFDVHWLCEEHPAMVAQEGVTVKLVFNVGIEADTDIVVMTYKNGGWNDIVSVANNGDGTVTCVFEDFCPVVMAVHISETIAPPQTGDSSNVILWGAVMVVAAIAVVVLLVTRRKDNG